MHEAQRMHEFMRNHSHSQAVRALKRQGLSAPTCSESWKKEAQRMSDTGSAVCSVTCQTRCSAQPADVPFTNREEQTEHYKLDWHRFNLRQKMAGMAPATARSLRRRRRWKDVLQHKTFHRYTVRAKRGTAQGLRDSQNRSHTPKSAGAALRRHNEAALVKTGFPKRLQDIRIFAELGPSTCRRRPPSLYEPPTYNKSIFFGGRRAPLLKTDPRIRTLPFATRRATFREVQRVHTMLSTVLIYEKDTDMSALSSMSKKVWKKRVQPAAQLNTDDDKVVADAGEEDEDEDAAEPEDSKLEKEEAAALRVDTSWEFGLRDALFTACKVGDVEGLCALLRVPAETPEQSEPALLNQPVDSSGFHPAARRLGSRPEDDASTAAGHRSRSSLAGTTKDGLRTPSLLIKTRGMFFRKYMGENPERYDYSKAQRALAAEKRLAEQVAETGVGLSNIR
ncbi:unnamed protein product [Lampetra planeri]